MECCSLLLQIKTSDLVKRYTNGLVIPKECDQGERKVPNKRGAGWGLSTHAIRSLGFLEHQDGGRKRKSPNPCETGACIIFDKYSLFIQMELLLLLVGEGSSRDLVDRNYQAQEYTPLHHPCAK